MASKQSQQYNSSPNHQASSPSKCFSTSFIQSIFSKEYFEHLKAELSQKTKPSKSILEALKHYSQLNLEYKKCKSLIIQEIAELREKLEKVQNSNNKPSNEFKVCNYVSETIQSSPLKDNKNLHLSRKSKQLQYVALEQISIRDVQNEQNKMSVELLLEKVKHLEDYKHIKELRFEEIIERQAQMVGEINCLKHKIVKLELLLKEKQIRLRNHEAGFGGEDKSLEERGQNNEVGELNNYINNSEKKAKYDFLNIHSQDKQRCSIDHQGLLVSQTYALAIDEQYNIDKNYCVAKKQQTNSVDEILEHELPNVTSSVWVREDQENSPTLLDQATISSNSIIMINLTGYKNMNESIIGIDLSDEITNQRQPVLDEYVDYSKAEHEQQSLSQNNWYQETISESKDQTFPSYQIHILQCQKNNGSNVNIKQTFSEDQIN